MKVGAICVALVLLVIAALAIGGGRLVAPTRQYTVLLSNANLFRRRRVSYAGSWWGSNGPRYTNDA